MWVEPFCSCVRCPSTTSTISSLTDRQSSFHNLTSQPSLSLFLLLQYLSTSQPSLSLSLLQHLSTFNRSDKKQVSVVAYFWKHIHGAQKRKHLPLSALCQACPKLSWSTKERKQYSFTHTLCQVSFHMCRVCVWDVWLYDPLSQACPKLSLPAYCVLFTVSFHLNWPLQILNSLQASQSHPSYLAFASLFFCWWFKCVGFPVPKHCPGEECSWT